MTMTSLRYKIFRFMLENRHIFSGKSKLDHFTHETPIEDFRAQVNKSHKLFGRLPNNVEMESIYIDNLYCEYIKHKESNPQKIILYFHGGGYVSGTCEAHRIHVSKLVKETKINSMVFEYRVAPENPFPAALDDALSAYNYLLSSGYKSEDIAFMGDSAGGGLCLATLNALKEKEMTLPTAVVVLSPWTDLKCTGNSYTTKLEVEPFAPKESWTVFSNYYVQDQDKLNPLISPLYGDLKDLPPLKIYVGTDEVLLDDSVRYAEKAKESGVEVSLTVGENMFHCYPICAPIFPEATEAMKEISVFLNDKLNITKEQ